MSRNIFIIGKSRLDIDIDAEGRPTTAQPGGALLNAATRLAIKGYPTYFVSELGRDAVGDRLAAVMADAGVNTVSVDRYTEGTTPTSLRFADGRSVEYGVYPSDEISIVWPRIEHGDIVIFGDAYTLQPRVHKQTMDLLRYASDMKALIIYAPLYPATQSHMLTHAMPAVLDSLETASLVIVDSETIRTFYATDDITTAYREHLSYYDAPIVYADSNRLSIMRPTAGDSTDIAATPTVADLVVAVAESAVTEQLSAAETIALTPERVTTLLTTISSNLT